MNVKVVNCLAMKLLVIIFLLFPLLISAKETNFGSVRVTEVNSIYDADTFRVTIKKWPDIIGKRIPIRIKGVDAPELRGKCDAEKSKAKAAKQFTVAALRSATTIELRNMKRGKYFRILADVFIDGRSLGKQIISNGYARPYDGGKRLGWCD